MFLTFPIMVIRVNTIYKKVEWRWINLLFIGVGSFVLSFVWRYLLKRKELGKKKQDVDIEGTVPFQQRIFEDRKIYLPAIIGISIFALAFPFIFSLYQTNIMISALIYIMLGLGINIVVGLAGLLDLGYVAFYAVGAYTYGLLHYHFNFNFFHGFVEFGVCKGFIDSKLKPLKIDFNKGSFMGLVWGDDDFGRPTKALYLLHFLLCRRERQQK